MPNTEYRKNSEYRIQKGTEQIKESRVRVIIRISDFGFHSGFGIRHSDFPRARRGLAFVNCLQPEAPQIFTIVLRVLLWCPHARQNILLDDDPAVIVGFAQLVNYCRKIHVSFPEFTKNSMLESGEIIPLFSSGALMDCGAAVFEMHVPNASAMAPQTRHRIPPAEPVMTRIEA